MFAVKGLALPALLSGLILISTKTSTHAQSPTATQSASSQPSRWSHSKLYADAKGTPLLKPTYSKEDGSAPTKTEMEEFERSEKLLKEATEIRRKGDFAEALKPAIEALNIRKKLFGDQDPNTVTAIGLANTLRRFAAARDSERLELKESDELQEKAEKAMENGEFAAAMESARQALEIRERILGKNYHELGATLRVYGGALTELNAFDPAKEVLIRGVEIVEKAYGKRHPNLAMILDRRGWLWINLRDFPRAIEDLQTACRIYKNIAGDTIEAAEAMDNLGTAAAASGDFKEAVQRKIRSLVVREALLGTEARDTGVSYSNLGWLYARLGAREEVIPLREKALATFEKVLGPDHPYTSAELVNLGMSYQEAGRHADAIKLYQKAVKFDDERNAPPDAKSVGRASRLAVAYLEAGRRDEGKQTMKRADQKAKAIGQAGNIKAAVDELQKISLVYEDYRMINDAIEALEVAQEFDGKAGSPPTAGRIGRSERLGALYTSTGRAQDAKKLLAKAIEESVQLFGKGDKRTGPALLAMVFACLDTGDAREAEKMADEVLRISETKVGTGSKANAFALRAMATVYLKQKRLDLAKFTLDDARKIIEPHQDDDPVEMIRFLLDYSDWQAASGDKTGSADTARDAVARCRKLAESVKTLHMDGLTARCLKRLIDRLAAQSTSSDQEVDSLRAELRQILEKLRGLGAMDAEEKKWLVELGGASAKD